MQLRVAVYTTQRTKGRHDERQSTLDVYKFQRYYFYFPYFPYTKLTQYKQSDGTPANSLCY